MKTHIKLKHIAFILFFSSIKAQVGIGTSTPSNSAILELNSNNKGLLFNKIALQSTNAATPLSSHQEGMWVYNTVTAGSYPNNVLPGLYYNDGTKWILISASESAPKVGDIKPSMNSTDHNGWYLLDGRNTPTITSTIAQQNAITLGYSTTIPNATDRILKGKTTVESLAVNGGSNQIILTQNNLPNFSMSGTTNTTGAHTHTISLMGNTFWNWVSGSGVTGLRFLQTETRTTASSGDHSHTITVPSGGSGTAINNYPKNMAVNYFIYLGK